MHAEFLKNVRTAVATSQTNNASTTFTNATGLSFPVMASTVYYFEFDIIWQSSSTTAGIGFAVNGPTGPTYVLVRTTISQSLTAVTQGMQRAYSTGTSTTTTDSANANSHARCFGFVSNGSTAGTLSLQFRSSSTSNVAVMPGTTGRIWRVNPSN